MSITWGQDGILDRAGVEENSLCLSEWLNRLVGSSKSTCPALGLVSTTGPDWSMGHLISSTESPTTQCWSISFALLPYFSSSDLLMGRFKVIPSRCETSLSTYLDVVAMSPVQQQILAFTLLISLLAFVRRLRATEKVVPTRYIELTYALTYRSKSVTKL